MKSILSKFKIDDLEATLRGIKKKLGDKGVKRQTIERLELLLTDKILQMLNESERQREDSASSTNLRKIEEEIGKDRISVALCLIGYDTYQRKNNEFGEAFTIQGLLASY